MYALRIEGGKALKGTVQISGSKNAALPILIASILLDNPFTLHNVPNLRDIQTTLTLLESLGRIGHFENNSVAISPKNLQHEAVYELVCTMRASVLVLGPLLARLGKARVAMPGGCAIGARPVDLHLSALEKMGANFDLQEGYIIGECKKLKGANIHFDFPTVGGTENLLMAAVLAEGETVLENAAREPEITDLANFLIACGAIIEGQGTSTIRVQGVEKLTGTDYAVMPDRIEAGTFMAAAGITGGDLLLTHCNLEDLEALSSKCLDIGLSISQSEEGIRVQGCEKLRAVDIVTRPFPGFPTDMQAQFMALMCVANGSSSIVESIFENRFMHVQELVRMGADIRLSGNTAIVRGVEKLIGAPVMASDLRASASLVLAGLAAQGTTTVQRLYHLDRGYEQMEKKLEALGATIERIVNE